MLKLFKNLKPFIGLIILGVLAVAGQAVMELWLPSILSDIINNGMLVDANGLAVIDKTEIIKNGLLMLGAAVIASALGVVSVITSSKVGAGFSEKVRQKLFLKVQSLSATDADKFGTASLINRSTNDVTQVQQLVIMLMRIVIFAPAMLIGGTIMAFTTDARMTTVLIISIPLLIGGAILLLKVAYPSFKLIQSRTDNLTSVMRENLTGVRVIRAFNKEQSEEKRFDKANKDLTETLIKAYRLMAVAMPAVIVLLNFSTIGVVFATTKGVQSGGWEASSIGNMVAVMEYVTHIMFSIMIVGMMAVMLPRAAVSAGRIQEVLETEPSIVDNVNQPLDKKFNGVIEFKNVGLKFAGAENYAIKDISFTAKEGQTTAIIGSTGSGKSTIVNLIPRFYDATEGEITLDGVNVKDIPLNQLRGQLGVVPQKAVLFSGTIAENLRFGCPEATDEEVKRAADLACADYFICEKEDKYDSIVAQNATNFSGGQKQRLSIARALVGHKKIYVFDDCFSALDFKTDAVVRENIKKELGFATVIIVAQRISTVMSADNIIVLDEGKIVGQGKHAKLMKSCKVYREIALSQLDEEELNNAKR